MAAAPFCFCVSAFGFFYHKTSNAAKFDAEAPMTCNNSEVGMTPDASTKSKVIALVLVGSSPLLLLQ
jgi:hypothetical protein